MNFELFNLKLKKLLLFQILRAIRPRQWLKNFSLFAAVLFGERLTDPYFFKRTLFGVVLFSFVSSAIYLVNDVIDAPRDRKHPYKKNRPIAAGKISIPFAILLALALGSVGLLGARSLSQYFFISLIFYIGLNILYSFKLRNVIILDALMIAAGFILRVFSGSLIDSVSMSSWLVLTTIGVSMLIAFGKRRSEKTILERENIELETRKTLIHYPDALLDNMIAVSSSITVLAYSFFAFQAGSQTALGTPFAKLLPPTLLTPKWMMLTIPLVIYGIGRYLYVIYEKHGGESPERVILQDKPLLGAVVAWFVMVVGIIYLL